jgi:hypothetical protein
VYGELEEEKRVLLLNKASMSEADLFYKSAEIDDKQLKVCITIIDTIILKIYTNDAYTHLSIAQAPHAGEYPLRRGAVQAAPADGRGHPRLHYG